MKRVPTKVTYLEMLSPVEPSAAAPEVDVRIQHVASPTVEFYRFLYDSVGRDYNWISRKLLSDDELARILQDERVDICVLKVAGEPGGFVELDRRKPGEIEIVQFGLFEQFIGQGLGKYFLQWTLKRAWSYQPKRVWLHTCDLDHRAALPNYLRAGFTVYDEKVIQQIVADK